MVMTRTVTCSIIGLAPSRDLSNIQTGMYVNHLSVNRNRAD